MRGAVSLNKSDGGGVAHISSLLGGIDLDKDLVSRNSEQSRKLVGKIRSERGDVGALRYGEGNDDLVRSSSGFDSDGLGIGYQIGNNGSDGLRVVDQSLNELSLSRNSAWGE